jgi:hypothetical protein
MQKMRRKKRSSRKMRMVRKKIMKVTMRQKIGKGLPTEKRHIVRVKGNTKRRRKMVRAGKMGGMCMSKCP